MKIIITEQQLEQLKKRSFFSTVDIEKGDFVDEYESKGILNKKFSSYKVEMVTLDSLEAAYGEDRNIKPIMRGQENYSEINIKKLIELIKSEGFKEPVILVYDHNREIASTLEGNHRIEVAKRLGYKEIPVKLEIMRIRDNFSREKDNMYPLKTKKVSAFNPIIPSDLNFIEGRPITPEDYK